MKHDRLKLALLTSPEQSRHLSLISCSFLKIVITDSPIDLPAGFQDIHQHYYEFLIPLNAITSLFIGDRELDCSPGRLIPINPGQLHGIRSARQLVSYILVFIEKEHMQSIIHQTCGNTAARFPTQSFPLDSEVRTLIASLISENQGENIGRALKLQCMAEQLAIELIRHYFQTSATISLIQPDQLAGEKKRFQKVVCYMHDNYHTRLSIEDLAGLLFMNTFYFIRIFKRCFRISPYSYLTRIRIFNATNMLLHTNLPVSEIGRRCGFQSASRFSAVFSGSTGMTPVRFRKTCRNT